MKLFLALLLLAITALAQPWSGILAPTRAIDWTHAGAAVNNRATPCATQPTLLTGSANAAANASSINSAITTNSGGNCVINLPAGTYSIAGQIAFINTPNLTLRGAGPNQTFLVWTSNGTCNGLHCDLYIVNSNANDDQNPNNTATWTAGYTQGAATITLGAVTLGSINNLHTGSLIILDQSDPGSDTGNIWSCKAVGGNCSQQGSSAGRASRSQTQETTVTSISGTGPWTIGINPGLYAPNWTSGQAPGAWWSNGVPISGVGIENLSMDHSAVGNGSGILIVNGSGNWITNVRSLNATGGVSAHIFLYQTAHTTIRDNYFFGANPSSEGYGIDAGFGSADNLIQNNICQHLPTCNIQEDSSGDVVAYNFAVDNFFGPGNFQQQDMYHHAAGDAFQLYEGNVGTGAYGDNIHGSSYMRTFFRNRITGRDTATVNGVKTQDTNPLTLQSISRYWNIVGNVFGTSGYHTNYQVTPVSTTDPGNSTTANVSIYNLGFSFTQGTHCNSCTNNSQSLDNDTGLATTTMRWGNWDTVTSTNVTSTNDLTGTRFNTGEDGHTAPVYPAITNASQTLPASFYLGAKPTWWAFPSGNASTPFPAVGPDVANGNLTNTGGHAYLNPAQNCYINVMGGSTTGSSGALTFIPSTCYTSSSPSAPNPPSGLSAVVN